MSVVRSRTRTGNERASEPNVFDPGCANVHRRDARRGHGRQARTRDLREIGEILNVAHILEGSVRTAGNRVRVTAQLITADEGFHLFSETYDRELDDIFSVQNEIAAAIGTALRATILDDETVSPATPTRPETYDPYLRARQWLHTRNTILMRKATALLDEALELDPDYAPR